MSPTFPSDQASDLWGIRISTCRRAPACTFRLIALSATVAAVVPGAAWGADGDLRATGWTAGSVRFEPAPGPDGLTVAGTGTYRGVIEVRRNGGALAVRNDLGLEDYVRGIDEVPPSWPVAALQAQAIAARTYAAHTALTGDARWREVGADICATTTCQVYRGLDAERRAQGYSWLPAVEATAGRALLAGGRPIWASYSSTANGPQAMSQNGALAMATEGRSTSDILNAYYGVRPTPAGSRLPSTIKVAVVMSAASARISSAGAFRVIDDAGEELAIGGQGEWRITPAAGGGVRIVPPESYRPEPPPPPPAAASLIADVAPVLRRPARVLTAAAPQPGRGAWPLAATGFVLAAGGGAVTLGRRRRCT